MTAVTSAGAKIGASSGLLKYLGQSMAYDPAFPCVCKVWQKGMQAAKDQATLNKRDILKNDVDCLKRVADSFNPFDQLTIKQYPTCHLDTLRKNEKFVAWESITLNSSPIPSWLIQHCLNTAKHEYDKVDGEIRSSELMKSYFRN